MLRFYTILFAILFAATLTHAQTIIAIQDFESTPASPIWNYISSGGAVSSVNTGTPANARVRNGVNSFQCSNASGSLTFDAVNVSGYINVKVVVHISSISGTGSNGADAADHVRLFTALNGNSFLSNTEGNADIAVNGNSNSRWAFAATGPFTNAGTNTVATGTAGTNQGTIQSTLTIQIPNGSNTVALRINTLNNDANEIWCIEDIEITGTPGGGSSITVLSSVSPFFSVTGVPSSEQMYTVSGSGLTGNFSINAPAGFEISTTSGTAYSSSVNLTPVSGSITNTIIYLRMNSALHGSNAGSVTHSSPGVTSQNISVTGNVFAIEPTVVSNISFSNIGPNEMDINFTSGNGSGRIVVMRSGSAIAASPVDGNSYTANNIFGSGATIDAGQFVVFNGNGNSVTVTGLNGGTMYHVAVFEYNDGGVPSATNYFAAGTGSQVTVSAPQGLQIATQDELYKIDFDNTVAGVNNGKFSGSGFIISPVSGQLNSNSWAMTGWTDGALSFGGTRTTAGTDYTRGSSNGGVSTGGVYAFSTSPGNVSLGFQPGGSDWAPGTVTLKIQNQTGTTIHTVGLAYKLFVLNDQGRSNSFNFSWSGDNSVYTDISALNFSSSATADLSPVWVQHIKSTTITGLSVAPGGYFYLRWNGVDAGGTGTRDEFGLDDITVSANPLAPIILPVRISELMAISKKEGIQLKWSNLTETDVESYVIERSSDGSHFIAISSQIPLKNDGTKADYSFLDLTPMRSYNFYRLKSIELNGKETYSKIIRISSYQGSQALMVYPNPVANEISIQIIDLSAGSYNIGIFNMSGQRVAASSMMHNGGGISLTLPLTNLKTGVYILKFDGLVHLERTFFKQ